MALEYELRDFTVDEYHRMAEIGIIDSDERVELLDGKIVKMSPLATRHWVLHARTAAYLHRMLPDAAIVGQGSFPLGARNEPQPDIAVLRGPAERYLQHDFKPADLFAVVEIADSSLATDLGAKRRLYARFGVADYLVADVQANRLLYHTGANGLGYDAAATLAPGDALTFQAFPGVRLAAAELLLPP